MTPGRADRTRCFAPGSPARAARSRVDDCRARRRSTLLAGAAGFVVSSSTLELRLRRHR